MKQWPLLFPATVVLAAMLASCSQAPEVAIDPEIAKALEQIKAIDNHAHPVRPVAEGEPADTGYDALPVENLEPSSDPVRSRPGQPAYTAASKAIFGGSGSASDRAAAHKAWGQNYAATVLDKAGIGKMVANRVAMGEGLPRERFLWAAFADALMYPFPTAALEVNPDRKAYFALEAKLLAQYYRESGVAARPATLDEYLNKVVTATLERHKHSGAVAEKFEMAYLRSLSIANPPKADVEKAWKAGSANPADYRVLQDFIFRHIALECGRLGMAVHFHTGSGAGGYYDTAGARPGLLEPLFNDPALRKTNFVMVHGGWPWPEEIAPLLIKPNAYVDISVQAFLTSESAVAGSLRAWLEVVPEKVLFGTDAYPYAPATNMGWEETTFVLARTTRRALAMALTQMLKEESVTRERAVELGRMVLHDNTAKLYGVK